MKNKTEFKQGHRAGGSGSFPLRSFVACAALLATTAFTTAEVRLKGNVGPRIINDDVVIARGNTCVLNGTTIMGDVRVLSGAKLYTKGAWVDGTVFAYRSLRVDLREASRVTWNVRANGSGSIRVQGRSQIGGHVRITRSSTPEGVDALLVRNSTVLGDIFAKDNKGLLRVMGNDIEGRLKFVENRTGKYVVRNNDVWNNVIFRRNVGTGVILDNTIGGNLVSSGNSPLPRVKRNTVRGDTVIE